MTSIYLTTLSGVRPAPVLSSDAATSSHSPSSCCRSSSCRGREVKEFNNHAVFPLRFYLFQLGHPLLNYISFVIFLFSRVSGGEAGGGLTPAMTLNSGAGIGVDDLRRLCILRWCFCSLQNLILYFSYAGCLS